MSNLTSKIVEMSEAKEWGQARREWSVVGVIYSEEPQRCLCGHTPIKEICTLRNHLNRNEVDVGNCCVTNFIDTMADNIFAALKRVRLNQTSALNPAAIEIAYARGVFNTWEKEFYLDTWRKRKLSFKMVKIRRRLNLKFIDYACKSTEGW